MEPFVKYTALIVWFISNILLSSTDDNSTSITTTTSSSTTTDQDTNMSTNSTNNTGRFPDKTSLPNVAMRTIYVISAVSALVIVYLIIRAACSRRKKSRTKRYGVLKNNRSDGMELHPLSEADDDDDDDDMTLFDLRQQRKVKP